MTPAVGGVCAPPSTRAGAALPGSAASDRSSVLTGWSGESFAASGGHATDRPARDVPPTFPPSVEPRSWWFWIIASRLRRESAGATLGLARDSHTSRLLGLAGGTSAGVRPSLSDLAGEFVGDAVGVVRVGVDAAPSGDSVVAEVDVEVGDDPVTCETPACARQ